MHTSKCDVLPELIFSSSITDGGCPEIRLYVLNRDFIPSPNRPRSYPDSQATNQQDQPQPLELWSWKSCVCVVERCIFVKNFHERITLLILCRNLNLYKQSILYCPSSVAISLQIPLLLGTRSVKWYCCKGKPNSWRISESFSRSVKISSSNGPILIDIIHLMTTVTPIGKLFLEFDPLPRVENRHNFSRCKSQIIDADSIDYAKHVQVKLSIAPPSRNDSWDSLKHFWVKFVQKAERTRRKSVSFDERCTLTLISNTFCINTIRNFKDDIPVLVLCNKAMNFQVSFHKKIVRELMNTYYVQKKQETQIVSIWPTR